MVRHFRTRSHARSRCSRSASRNKRERKSDRDRSCTHSDNKSILAAPIRSSKSPMRNEKEENKENKMDRTRVSVPDYFPTIKKERIYDYDEVLDDKMNAVSYSLLYYMKCISWFCVISRNRQVSLRDDNEELYSPSHNLFLEIIPLSIWQPIHIQIHRFLTAIAPSLWL